MTRAAPGVLERADEKQEPAELVVGAFRRAAMEALHDVNIHPADGLERPRFVLAILELAFLMRRKRRAESRCDRFSQLRSCAQREQP